MSEKIADDEWEWYIGQLYAKLIEKVHGGKLETVVELAPGFRYKIAYALKEFDFRGNLYVIDTNEEVLEYVKKMYIKFIPEANIICINKNFENCFEDIPDVFDLFLSNHSIDDMIIAEYMEKAYTKNLGNDDFRDILSDAWKELGKNTSMIDNISNHVYSLFKNFFNEKKIETIIISQYKSNLYFKDEFKEMDEITENCFKKIKELVNMDNDYINKVLEYYPFGKDDERYNGKYLLDNTQNAKNWIVGEI